MKSDRQAHRITLKRSSILIDTDFYSSKLEFFLSKARTKIFTGGNLVSEKIFQEKKQQDTHSLRLG